MSMAVIAGFFGFVMASVTAAGLAFLRFRPVPSPVGGPAGDTANSAWVTETLETAGRLVSSRDKKSEHLRMLLFRAGYRSPHARSVFQGIQLVAAVLIALVVAWSSLLSSRSLAHALLPAVCSGGFGFLLPARILEYLVRARAHNVRRALPPALDLFVLAIEAGHPLDQALQDTAIAIKNIYPDLGSELLFCTLEMRAGTSRPDALRRLGERSGEEELRKLAVVLIDGERFGTSLGPALRSHARYLRTRMRQQAQESARKLTVKLVVPVFFLIFPSVLLVTLGPAYIQLNGFLDNFMK